MLPPPSPKAPKRSTIAGLLLSATVAASFMSAPALVMAADAAPASAPDATPAPAVAPDSAPAAAPAAAPAPAGGPVAGAPLQNLADDFMHYSLVNNVELAKANADALLASNADPKDLLAAFEAAANGRDPREIMIRDQNRAELKDVSVKLLDQFEAGHRAVSRDPVRIRTEIDRLADGPRAYSNARDRLEAAGQFAAPFFIETLQDANKMKVHPYVIRVMGEIGRPLLLPLMEDLKGQDQTTKIAVVKVIGQIGYPQALTALRALQADSSTGPDLKAAVDGAISLIDRNGAAAKASPAELYLQSAQNYYDKKASYLPLHPSEATNPVWVYDKGLNNVQALAVPTPIWNDVMASRDATEALKLDASNPAVLSLWLAANLRRDIDLPKGVTDPTREANQVGADFYALAAGPMYVNPVLSKALDAHDTALALRAIDALESTYSINELVSGNAGSPLIRALNYPDRVVRYRAAFSLARANPAVQFPSYFRVVPILAEAISGSPSAIIVSSDDNTRNHLADVLRNGSGHYTVYSGPTLSAALQNSHGASSFGVIVVPSAGEIASAGGDYRVQNTPVLVATSAANLPATTTQLIGNKGYAAIDEAAADDAAITAAVNTARNDIGNTIPDQTTSDQFAKTAIDLLATLAADHKSIYLVTDALPALTQALGDKRPETSSAAAKVLGLLNNTDAQKSLAAAALKSDADAATRVALFNNLAESAKHTGNALDSTTVNSIVTVVTSDPDANVRKAAATALGALNIPTNQAAPLILQAAAK